MNFKRILITIAATLLPLAASATTLVVPASGTGPGINDSHWQTELTLHNTSASLIAVTLTFHDSTGAAGTASVTVAPRATVTIADVVGTRFGRQNATGAIEVSFDSIFARKLTVSSRTFNKSAAGEFGQDIPSVDQTNAAAAGDIVVLSGPSSTAGARFNFGLYAVDAATVRWDLVRADGTLASSKEIAYAAGSQAQYNNGVAALFNVDSQDNDTVHAVVTKGHALPYGSVVNNASGDPTYVPGVLARADFGIDFAGINFSDSSKIDIADANHDGVLDQAIDVHAGSFPTAFRVVVNSATPATFELIDAPADARFYDTHGGIVWTPTAFAAGTSTTLKLRVTADGVTEVISIPVNIR
jgi:hypothetical protein